MQHAVKHPGALTAKARKEHMSAMAFAHKVMNSPKGKYSGTTRKQASLARTFAKYRS
jgi:hypothetical protein